MEDLIVLILGGAVIYLWHRTSDLQRQIGSLRDAAGYVPNRTGSLPQEPSAATVPAKRMADLPKDVPDERVVSPEIPSPPPPRLDTEPEPEPVEPRRNFTLPEVSLDFEDLFGRRLPIWAGGIALAVAGFFLVRYSIEAGLITPSVRVMLGFAFGLALLAAAEAAFRFEGIIKDERVRQALAGAGLATLYASFYLAGSVYGLIGSTVSFIGLAAVTAAAIGLSFRFGLPCAILGLVGGFAAPTLVGSEEANLPMLALYLALVTAGLALTGKRQDRAWLGLASLGGALGWGVLLLMSGPSSFMDTLAVGGFLLLLGAAMPLLLAHGSLRGFGRLAVAGLATLQMAVLVDQANYGFLAWSLYALLAAGIAVLGWQYPKMREGSAVAAATALWMLAIWPDPAGPGFASIAAVFAAIFAGMPLLHLWRGEHRFVDIWQLSAFPLGLIAGAIWHFTGDFDTMQAALTGTALALAAFPAIAAWRLWPKAGEPLPRETAITLASATIALFVTGLLATPLWAAPLVGGGLAAAIAALGWGRSDTPIANIGWGLAGATLIACLVTVDGSAELERIVGDADNSGSFSNILRWSITSLAFVVLALTERRKLLRQVAEVFASAFAFVAIAQVVPAYYLAWVTAAAATLLAWRMPVRVAGQSTLLAIAGLWAMWPVLVWTEAGMMALLSVPMLVSDLPTVMATFMRIVPVMAAGSGLLYFAASADPRLRKVLLGGIVALGFVVAHVLFKQLFALESPEQFRNAGLIERSVWQALLLAAAYGLYRQGVKTESVALTVAGQITAGAAFAHFAYFTILLHNPLWAEQWVGPWPIATWLVPVYAIGIAALLLLRRSINAGSSIAWPLVDAGLMGLISLFALSELRSAFAGGWLTSIPVAQTEDLVRSLLGIVLAIGFLLWGARIQARSWRIGSLVLMLGAVLKVFLFDTAALEGLGRIASFMALGFSLIGIGWFYSKQLSRPATPT